MKNSESTTKFREVGLLNENNNFSYNNPELTAGGLELALSGMTLTAENPELTAINMQLAAENPELVEESLRLAAENPELTASSLAVASEYPERVNEENSTVEDELAADEEESMDNEKKSFIASWFFKDNACTDNEKKSFIASWFLKANARADDEEDSTAVKTKNSTIEQTIKSVDILAGLDDAVMENEAKQMSAMEGDIECLSKTPTTTTSKTAIHGQSTANMNSHIQHKVDEPPKPKKVKPSPDNVNTDIDKVKVEVEQKPKKVWPTFITDPLPRTSETLTVEPVYDNSAVTNAFWYMREIEKIAAKYNVSLRMAPKEIAIDGKLERARLIEVYPIINNSPTQTLIPFTIDTGYIIDRRVKLSMCVSEYGYEELPLYQVLSVDGKKLNAEIFEDMFSGKYALMSTLKPMYTEDYMHLNKKIALITFQSLPKDNRKEIINFLMKAVKEGRFDVIDKNLGARTRFALVPKSYNNKAKTFSLVNCPVYYRMKSSQPLFINGIPVSTLEDGTILVNVDCGKNKITVQRK